MSRPKLRKVNTQRRKQERREAERNLKRRANMLLDIDENCCVCRAPFDKKNKEMAHHMARGGIRSKRGSTSNLSSLLE